jgi:hypothetical protein
VAELEYDYNVFGERIVRLPEPGTSHNLEEIVAALDFMHLERASRIQILYVVLEGIGVGDPSDDRTHPVFIANVYGVHSISSRLPDDEASKRIRQVLDDSLKPLYADNAL